MRSWPEPKWRVGHLTHWATQAPRKHPSSLLGFSSWGLLYKISREDTHQSGHFVLTLVNILPKLYSSVHPIQCFQLVNWEYVQCLKATLGWRNLSGIEFPIRMFICSLWHLLWPLGQFKWNISVKLCLKTGKWSWGHLLLSFLPHILWETLFVHIKLFIEVPIKLVFLLTNVAWCFCTWSLIFST